MSVRRTPVQHSFLFTIKEPKMSVRFKVFALSSNMEKLCEEAAAFASEITPERLIGISPSQYSPPFGAVQHVVTVWYWDGD